MILDPASVRESMHAALNLPDARIEIVEVSNARIPIGHIEFPLSGLVYPSSAQSEGPLRWRGQVRYGENKTSSVWARVLLRAPSIRFIAVEDLKAGSSISPSQLRVEKHEGIPDFRYPLKRPEDLDGWVLRKSYRAGSRVDLRTLDPPVEVERGERVEMELRANGILLKVETVAESAGRRGQTVRLKNPMNGKKLSARVEGKGRVSR
jgi:flagella basal body P-ring formation protein FlgA